MRKYWILALILGLSSTVSVQGYVYDIKGLRKWHPEYKCYCYWIGCCDFHDKIHQASCQHRKKIEELLPMYNPADVLVVVEDLSSVNDAGCFGCGAYYINSRVGVLAGLGNFCKEQKIPLQNVEYRYCRVVALGPIINNINADPALFPSTGKMKISTIIQEIERAQLDLLFYNPTAAFQAHITAQTNKVMGHMKKFNLMQDQEMTIAHYLQAHTTPLNRLEIVKDLLTFDGIFIGMKFAGATMNAPYKKKIIALGGGTHINEAYELLQKIDGWEPIAPHELKGIGVPVLGKSIGTYFGNNYYAKPVPISLEVLEHYLHK